MIFQATDVAARGIDVPETDLVIQGEINLPIETYTKYTFLAANDSCNWCYLPTVLTDLLLDMYPTFLHVIVSVFIIIMQS